MANSLQTTTLTPTIVTTVFQPNPTITVTATITTCKPKQKRFFTADSAAPTAVVPLAEMGRRITNGERLKRGLPLDAPAKRNGGGHGGGNGAVSCIPRTETKTQFSKTTVT
jgi:hypothetical protein